MVTMALQHFKASKFEDIDDLLPELVALRHDLHASPELAFEERRTAGIVAASLRLLGLDVHEGAGRHRRRRHAAPRQPALA